MICALHQTLLGL